MEKWDESSLVDFPFVDYNVTSSSSIDGASNKKMPNLFLGFLISVVIGIYAGLLSRVMQESWIYSMLFCFEALASGCIAAIIKNITLRRTICSFAFYFISSATITPLTCFLHLKFYE